MQKPTLFLTVGLPATGKTTMARQIEAERNALRLTKDEWIKALYGQDNPAAATDVVEGRLIRIGLRGLELGINVVIDFGLWSRNERSALRHAAVDVGAAVVMLSCEATPAEQRDRLAKRLEQDPRSTWPISDEELATYAARFEAPTAGEVDGSEPIDDVPTGFASWHEWIADRWPSRMH
jgi:predicted kinase